MEWVTAIMYVLHKMNPAAYSWALHGLSTILWFASSRSDDVCLLTELKLCEQLPKFRVCDIYTAHSSMETTTADVCLKQSPGSYMKQMVNIM